MTSSSGIFAADPTTWTLWPTLLRILEHLGHGILDEWARANRGYKPRRPPGMSEEDRFKRWISRRYTREVDLFHEAVCDYGELLNASTNLLVLWETVVAEHNTRASARALAAARAEHARVRASGPTFPVGGRVERR